GEILSLNKRDIKWFPDGWGSLMIWATRTKNKEYRTIPLPPEIMGLMGTRGSGLLFEGWTKKTFEYRWTHMKVSAAIAEPENHFHRKHGWAKNAILDPNAQAARFHDLRHTFCRIFLEKRAGDLDWLSRFTGHKS